MLAGAGAGQTLPPPPRLRVSFGEAAGRRELEFDKPFRIGRQDDCEVCLKDEYVSRVHVEVVYENGQWLVRDLNSANGLFAGGQRVPSVPIAGATDIRLGIYGPVVSFAADEPSPLHRRPRRQ